MSSLFLQSIKETMIARHYSKNTINSYLYWIKFYILFHKKQHPAKLGDNDVTQFLEFLAVKRNVAAKTQASALNALVFLYKEIIKIPLDLNLNFVRSKRDQKLPTVLTTTELQLIMNHIPPNYELTIKLLYGSGLRLMECLRLRYHDIDFDYGAIRIWQAKGRTVLEQVA
ncbi:phage integrase N-terminal SAM-like domain-containing protein [Vibrio salinus]|uniref:phage integrase N-terminal SAM-like domain-containing protein n=1 Tax=Vibrio salinus TaxID=2899784 RepID=UPI001E43245E|nr:phage integrase N-terminal SAM-like domain-containing protein [Vibrio salinus]MCE0495432.1 phage integrase N-terminal SAM-like domain-containing protein [Vibrio salinus]